MAGQQLSSGAANGQKTPKGLSRRAEIIVAAVEVFSARGYEGASLREIAESIGASKGNLNYYFALKDDLLFEIVSDLHDAFLDHAARWHCCPGDPRQTLREAARGHVILVCEKAKSTRVSYEDFRYLSTPRRALITEKRDAYEEALRNLIVECRPPASAVPDVSVATKAILGSMNWLYQWYSPSGPRRAVELADLLTEATMQALGMGHDPT